MKLLPLARPACTGLTAGALLLASTAHADKPAHSANDRAEQVTLARVRGTVERTEWIDFGAGPPFVAVRIGSLASSEHGSPIEDAKLVPYAAGVCDAAFGFYATTDRDRVASLDGAAVDGLLVHELRHPPNAPGGKGAKKRRLCRIVGGAELLPGATTAEPPDVTKLVRDRGDELLPVLARLSDVLGCPRREGVSPTCETPIDLHTFELPLRELRSAAALEFALARGLDHFASRHFHWRREPDCFPVVWKYATHPGEVAPFWVIEMLWRLAPSRADELVRELFERDPARALELVSPLVRHPRSLDLFVELSRRGGDEGVKKAVWSLGTWADEHTRLFLETELAKLAPGDPSSKAAADRLAKFDARAAAGVVDGHSLGRYLAARENEPLAGLDSHDMRLTVVGTKQYPGIQADLGSDVRLKVDLEMDAEQRAEWRKIPDGATVTATGVVESTFVGRGPPRYVDVDLDFVIVKEGGLVPAATPIPEAPPPTKSAGGCGCVVGDGPAPSLLGAGALAALTFASLVARRARRRVGLRLPVTATDRAAIRRRDNR